METKDKLIRCARDEFAEKGYMKASLRSICNKADVTTGALYFFFEDKDDLFRTVVGEALEELEKVMFGHYSREDEADDAREQDDDDRQTAQNMMRVMYRYRTEFDIILTKAQGSSLENIVDRFVAVTREHHISIADKYSKGKWKREKTEMLMDWMARTVVDAFIYAFSHFENEEDAVNCVTEIGAFIRKGWFSTFV